LLVLCIMDDAVKNAFVSDVLKSHGEFVVSMLNNSISELSLIKAGNLQGSVSFDVSKNGNDYMLSFNFKGYGRAIEIAYFRKARGLDVTKKLFGIKSREDIKAEQSVKSRKNTRWYSKNAYGSLNTLYGRLSYGFTNEEAQRLKAILEEAATAEINSSIVVL